MSEHKCGKNTELPGDLWADEGHSLASSEIIDLSSWFTKDLTLSGSFNLCGVGNTTLGRLLNAIPVPTGLVDNDYRFTFCNEAWQKLSSQSVKMEGESFLEMFLIPREATTMKSTVDKVYEERR